MGLEYILSLPKSFYVSWRLTSFRKALHLPILVRYNTKIVSLKGHVEINNSQKQRATVVIGFNNVGIYDKKYSRPILQIEGIMVVNGQATFGQGAKVCIMRKGKLIIGDNFNNTAEGSIICSKQITIGKNCLMSWETIIMDSDWHRVKNTESEEISEDTQEIYIDDNVWIGLRATILKGATIPSGCIVAANTTVTKTFHNRNTLLAGSPAKERKHNVTRQQ